MQKISLFICVMLMTVACSKQAVKPAPTPADKARVEKPVTEKPASEQPTTDQQQHVTPTEEIAQYTLLKPANWQDLDGLLQDNVTDAWPAWLQSCMRLGKKEHWKAACDTAQLMKQPNNAAIIDYFSNYFDVYRAYNEDGTSTGTITGYYQPLLNGSKTQSTQYPYPLYREPADLITVELAEAYPELKFKRIRGKLEGKKLVPYRTRAEIDTKPSPLAGDELFWIDDIIDVFFLQIQGSGVVQLDNGEQVQVGYANQNGYPYKSIGRLLVEQGELTLDKASMQGIKNWARNHPDKLQHLLNSNPSYVFFRELPAGLPGPLGALNVPIFAERSVAIDPKFIPLGAPIFLSTTEPNSNKPLKRLMLAQDTGGAIRGGVRADFFWGAGDAAGAKAGSMKQQGEIWVLLPKGFVVGE
ncbi:MAG: murein transglycosylase A [Methylophilaceae bacterium]|nr:MAG: murein transglycosylase A [Methylophilaceae bacterium]